MQIPMSEIIEAGLGAQMGAPDPVAEAIYRLYTLPPAVRGRRVVINKLRRPHAVDRAHAGVAPEEAAQLVWDVLCVAGRRAGEVVYDGRPRPADFVLHHRGSRYVVASGVPERAEEPVLMASAAV